jgi:hypothetical protein
MPQSSRVFNPKFLVSVLPLNGFTDDMIRANNATWAGTEAYVKGDIGRQMANLDGSSYLAITDDPSLDLDSSLSITFRFKTASDTKFFIDKRTGNNINYRILLNPNKIQFQIGDGTNTPSILGSTVVNDNREHICTCIRNVGSDTIEIYIDSAPDATPVTDTTTATIVNAVDLKLCVRSDNTLPITGQFGDLYIHNIALTGDEVIQLHKLMKRHPILRGVPVTATMKDQPSVYVVDGDRDLSQSAKTITNTGMVIGNGISNDGTAVRFMSLGKGYDLTGDFSIETVVEFNNDTDNQGIIALGDGYTTGGNGFLIQYRAADANDPIAIWFNNGNVTGLREDYNTGGLAALGKKHVAATFNRVGNCILYIDGTSVLSFDISGYQGNINASNLDLWISRIGGLTSGAIDGKYQFVKVYDSANATPLLTAEQVQHRYLQTRKYW